MYSGLKNWKKKEKKNVNDFSLVHLSSDKNRSHSAASLVFILFILHLKNVKINQIKTTQS